MRIKIFIVTLKHVSMNGDLTEWFSIDTSVRKGCVMSPWLFIVFIDGVLREVRILKRH